MAPRTLILGTAGHVDHGKTALVGALTGTDTDRLEEEHRRGISIELGFAPLDLSDDLRFGVVDVPGHERFVRQMVAGAGGMDVAMLLIAADEGIMPQTREHLDVLQLLGVPSGLVVLTKMDLADPDLVEVVASEIEELVRGTFLEGAPVVRVSAHTGDGLDQLRTALRELASTVPPRGRDGAFRLPADRVFVLSGTGVVITGTAWSGSVSAGDALRVMPQDLAVRVRDVQSHGRPATSAGAGERVALALHGVKKDDVSRGDQVVGGDAWVASLQLGVRVRMVGDPSTKWILKPRSRVHVHHAAREVLARVDLLGQPALGPGATGLVRLRLETPLVAAPGDRLVIRSYSPMITIAGGAVLDPDLPAGERGAEVAAWLQRLDDADPAEFPWLSLHRNGAAGLTRPELTARSAWVGQSVPDVEAELARREAAGDVVVLGDRVLDAAALVAPREAALALLRAHQTAQPLSLGLSREELRQEVAPALTAPTFSLLLHHWATQHPFFPVGDKVRADSARPELGASHTDAVQALRGRIEAARPAYQATADELRSPELRLLLDEGFAEKLGGPLVTTRAALEELRQRAGEHFAHHEVLEVSHVKEWTGGSRKFVMPILEWFDAHHVTHFDGRQRRRGSDCP